MVDNGQHVVLGCYRETFAYLDASRRARGDRAAGPARSAHRGSGWHAERRCDARRGPRPCTCWLASCDGRRWAGGDRLSALRLAPQLTAAAGASVGRTPAGRSAWNGRPSDAGSQRHGQTARLCEMLWEPLAVAALNQPIDRSPRPRRSCACSAACSARVRAMRRLGCRRGRCRRCSATRARTYPRAARESRAPARAGTTGARARPRRRRRRPRRTRLTRAPVVVGRALVGVADPRDRRRRERRRSRGPLRDAARARAASPIVTVNLWPERPWSDAPFVGLPGPCLPVGVRDELTPTPRRRARDARRASAPWTTWPWCRAARTAIAHERDDVLVARAWHELSDGPAGRVARAPSHTRVVRERHATFSLAPGQPPRPSMRTAVPRTLARRRLDRHGPAGDHRGRRAVGPPRGRARLLGRRRGPDRMISRDPDPARALPGTGAQGPQSAVVRGSARAEPARGHRRPGVAEMRPVMGRVELGLRPGTTAADGGRGRAPVVAQTLGVASVSIAALACPPTWTRSRTRRSRWSSGREAAPFRVAAARADKRFPLASPDIERHVGGALQQATGWRVDLVDPASGRRGRCRAGRSLRVGRPAARAGRPAGGRERPRRVPALGRHRLAGRGVPPDAPRVPRRVRALPQPSPDVDARRRRRPAQLVAPLTRYQLRSRLVLVPFGDVQRQRGRSAPPALRVVLYRRFMLRIAERSRGAGSQRARWSRARSSARSPRRRWRTSRPSTPATTLPVLRPLIGMDKEEITAEARAHRHARHLDPAGRGLLPGVHPAAPGDQRERRGRDPGRGGALAARRH